MDTPLYDSQDYDTDEAVQYRELRQRVAADVLRNKVDGTRREPRRPYLQTIPNLENPDHEGFSRRMRALGYGV